MIKVFGSGSRGSNQAKPSVEEYDEFAPEELSPDELRALPRPPLGSYIELPNMLAQPAFVASITERKNGDFVMHCITEGKFGPMVVHPLGSVWHQHLKRKARETGQPMPMVFERPKTISPHWPWDVERIDLTKKDETWFDRMFRR